VATLIPALVALRRAFDAAYPGRDRASDGWIGDPAHASGASDHNPDESGRPEVVDADSVDEVHALDVDAGLDGGDPAAMERAVQAIVRAHRFGREDRLRYVIYRRRIWSERSGWEQRSYTGSNPHDEHAHFSGSYVAARERDGSNWDLGEAERMAITDADLERIAAAVLTDGAFDFTRRRAMAAVTGRADVLPEGERNRLHEKLDALAEAVEGLPAACVAALGQPGATPETVAQVLRAVLGDRAADVGRLLIEP
jgi:hypothetical protein